MMQHGVPLEVYDFSSAWHVAICLALLNDFLEHIGIRVDSVSRSIGYIGVLCVHVGVALLPETPACQ